MTVLCWDTQGTVSKFKAKGLRDKLHKEKEKKNDILSRGLLESAPCKEWKMKPVGAGPC